MMFCCLMGLNLEWTATRKERRRTSCGHGRDHDVPMGTWEGEGHWGEEGVLCYFQVQLLLKCNFVLQLRLASKLTSRRAGTHASPHKGFNDSLRIGTRSVATSGMTNNDSE